MFGLRFFRSLKIIFTICAVDELIKMLKIKDLTNRKELNHPLFKQFLAKFRCYVPMRDELRIGYRQVQVFYIFKWSELEHSLVRSFFKKTANAQRVSVAVYALVSSDRGGRGTYIGCHINITNNLQLYELKAKRTFHFLNHITDSCCWQNHSHDCFNHADKNCE